MPETKKNVYFGLTADELKTAQEIIDKASRGRYTLKKLYGKAWPLIASPTSFGERFAASVTHRQLQSVAFYGAKTGANAIIYDVKGGLVIID